MSSNVTLNGVQYIIPAYNDTGWAQGAGNLSLYLAAIASATLQPTGGAFTLTADADFGPNFGLKAIYLKSETANISTSGVVRLASSDILGWRNNANSSNIALGKDSSDNLQWNSTKILLSGAVVNADINASAAIAYSKLALSNSIVNADIASAAAIAYSKLALTGSILNADLAGSIAVSKLVALTASRALASDASGFLSASSVTSTELGFVSGVTSAIQTQINSKQATLTAGQLPGTATNDNASAGNVGEYIESVVGSTSFPATGTIGDLTTISLTAGDWDVTAVIYTVLNGATATDFACGISTTAGNSFTGIVAGSNRFDGLFASGANVSGSIPCYRMSLASTTTVRFKITADYTVGTPKIQGRLSARRMR